MEQKPITKESALLWLSSAAKYFEEKSSNGEDRQHWANVANAQTARRIAGLIESILND